MAGPITLLASAARVASGSLVVPTKGVAGSIYPDLGHIHAAIFLLNFTVVQTVAGDTCNVYIQSAIDGGTIWDDFVAFTQVLGNGGLKKFVAQWQRDAPVASATALHGVSDAALAAGVINGPAGPDWRVKWTIAGTGSFTFDLGMRPLVDARH